MNPLNTEAGFTIGGVVAAIGAFLVLLQEFGIGISESAQVALLKFAAIALPLIVGVVTRGFVWSHQSVVEKAAESFKDGQEGAKAPPEVH